MTNEKFQAQLIQARRDQIIAAAIELFAEQGFQRTTIKQIATRADVADGTIYNYFKNKDAILLGIVSLITEAEVRDAHFAVGSAMPYAEFVTSYVAHRMEELKAGLPVLKAILPETMVNAELSRTINEKVYAPSFAVAEKYFANLMERGELPQSDPMIAARIFASPLLGLMMLRLMGDEHVEAHWDEYASAAAEFLLNASRSSGTEDVD